MIAFPQIHPLEFLRQIPKVELHRHLEGSIRLSTLLDIGSTHNMDLPGFENLGKLVQISSDDQRTPSNFLSKFQILRQFFKSPDVIDRITREAVADAAEENIRYLELRFTPVALSRIEGFPLDKVMDWVVNAAQEAEREFQITTRLIASINRHESVQLAEKVAQLSVDRMGKGLVGLDLAGDEVNYDGHQFIDVFKEAQRAGLKATIHAGEWGSASRVMDAMLYLNADRIGHGIRVIDDPTAVALAYDRKIPFEICLTSNFQSGALPDSDGNHPISRMVDLGLISTINTDDPSICRTSLSREYQFACDKLGLDWVTITTSIQSAIHAAFLPEVERQKLANSICSEIALLRMNTCK